MDRTAAAALYRSLMALGAGAVIDPFERHVAAAIMALAVSEAAFAGMPVSEHSGLDPADQKALVALAFPGARLPVAGSLVRSAQEGGLSEMLWLHAARGTPFERLLSRMIARRALRPNHLWQDLGLASRAELRLVMERHFPALARRNAGDMKWKKFFYRILCITEGFGLCAAPVCSECDEFDQCFGSEDGEALLARLASARTGQARGIAA